MLKHHIIIFVLLLILIVSFSASAQESPPFPLHTPLNKISYSTTVEKWATTQTVNVTMNMDAVLDKVGLSNVNAHVLEALHKMAADADWHVTQFNRNQDKSGLEMLHVEAQARLSQNALVNLRQSAKNISKPGETYTVGDIDFMPSLSETEKTHADARSAIYDQVKQEITRLNQVYPEQHYFLNQLDFTPTQVLPVMFKTMHAEVNMAAAPAPAPNIPMNAKVTETAQVVIAAKVQNAGS